MPEPHGRQGPPAFEIDTIERTEIINARLGLIDVIVGINLLREGLDIPEVTWSPSLMRSAGLRATNVAAPNHRTRGQQQRRGAAVRRQRVAIHECSHPSDA